MREIDMLKVVHEKIDSDWFRYLPLIDLDGMDEKEKVTVILGRVRECLFGLPATLREEFVEGDSNYQIVSSYIYGDETVEIIVVYHLEHDLIRIKIPFRKIPESQKQTLYEMINSVNARFPAWHFFISPDTHEVTLESGVYVAGYFDGRDFFLLLRQMIANGFLYMRAIELQMFSGRTPSAILEEYDNDIKILWETSRTTV